MDRISSRKGCPMMKYKLPVIIEKINATEYMARSELVRATAVGDTPEEAVENLKEAIEAMIEEFGIDPHIK